jgi:voltage-gated potassium channel
MTNQSPKLSIVETFIKLLIVYSVGMYFAEMAICDTNRSIGFWLWSERVVAVIFTFEYFYRWVKADDRLRYPISILGIIDLVSILPFYIGFAFYRLNPDWLRVVRTLRIIRILKLTRYNSALQNLIECFKTIEDELKIIGYLALTSVLFSGVAIFEIERVAQPDKFQNVLDGIWWSVVTATTVGYGDLFPISVLGRTIAILSMLFTLGLVGGTIGLVSGAIQQRLQTLKTQHHACQTTNSE